MYRDRLLTNDTNYFNVFRTVIPYKCLQSAKSARLKSDQNEMLIKVSVVDLFLDFNCFKGTFFCTVDIS